MEQSSLKPASTSAAFLSTLPRYRALFGSITNAEIFLAVPTANTETDLSKAGGVKLISGPGCDADVTVRIVFPVSLTVGSQRRGPLRRRCYVFALKQCRKLAQCYEYVL